MKCINCYREIKDTVKFCTYCGTKQPADRAAYEREHPELADAMPDEDVNVFIKQEQERLEQERQEQERLEQERQEQERQRAEQERLRQEQERQQAMQQQQQQQQQQNVVYDITGESEILNQDQDHTSYGKPQIPHPVNNPVVPSSGAIVPNYGNLPQQAAHCPECGQMVPAMALSCPYCGAPLQGGDSTVALTPSGGGSSLPPVTPSTSLDRGKNKTALIAIAAVLVVGILGILGYYLYQRNKATYISAETQTVSLARKGGEKTVGVSTDGNYFEVTQSPDWLTVSTNERGIVINCTPLSGESDRSGTIVIKSGSKSTQVAVTQRAHATFIRLSEETVEQGRDEGDHNISIESDGSDFNITAPDYCSVSNVSDQGFSLHIDKNHGNHRSGTVKVTDGHIEATLAISQKGICSSCGGRGKVTCSRCGGSGEEWFEDYYDYWYDICTVCGGDGEVRCSKCGGSGIR